MRAPGESQLPPRRCPGCPGCRRRSRHPVFGATHDGCLLRLRLELSFLGLQLLLLGGLLELDLLKHLHSEQALGQLESRLAAAAAGGGGGMVPSPPRRTFLAYGLFCISRRALAPRSRASGSNILAVSSAHAATVVPSATPAMPRAALMPGPERATAPSSDMARSVLERWAGRRQGPLQPASNAATPDRTRVLPRRMIASLAEKLWRRFLGRQDGRKTRARAGRSRRRQCWDCAIDLRTHMRAAGRVPTPSATWGMCAHCGGSRMPPLVQ